MRCEKFLDISLISKYPSMYMYILQSVQYSDHVECYKVCSTLIMYMYILQSLQYSEHVDMLQSLQYPGHVYAHIMKSADRTCLVPSLPRNIQLVQGLLNTTKRKHRHWSDGHSVYVKH